MDPVSWIAPLASVVVVSSGIIFFGYGIFRERLKAAKDREQGMLDSLNHLADAVAQSAAARKDSDVQVIAAIEHGFQKLREDTLQRENEELRRRLD